MVLETEALKTGVPSDGSMSQGWKSTRQERAQTGMEF